MVELMEKLRQFSLERDWEQFHTPENLAKSVAIEAGELLECFQWSGEADRHAVADELCDVFSYVLMLADKMDIDLKQEMVRKMAENAAKYPVELCRSKADKYTAYAQMHQQGGKQEEGSN